MRRGAPRAENLPVKGVELWEYIPDIQRAALLHNALMMLDPLLAEES